MVQGARGSTSLDTSCLHTQHATESLEEKKGRLEDGEYEKTRHKEDKENSIMLIQCDRE